MSPELFDPEQFGFEKCRRTKESDCYALGMVILEVLSGQAPFPRDVDVVVMRKVTKGDRPGKPQGAEGAWFTDDLWETLTLCWSSWPGSRPTIEAVLDCLKRVSGTWQPLPLGVGGDVETDSDDEFSFTVSGPRTSLHSISNPSLTLKGRVSGSTLKQRLPRLSAVPSTPGSLPLGSSDTFAGNADAREDGVKLDPTTLAQPPGSETSVDSSTPKLPRKKLQLLPRSKPVMEENEADKGSIHSSEGEGTNGTPLPMSEAEARKEAADAADEFFSARNIDESECYFTKLPSEYRHLLVYKMVSRAVESKEADVVLVTDAFARAATKELCSISAFEEGFLPVAELLDDIVIDAPRAFQLMATLMKGARLDKDEERRGRIAQKLLDGDKLVGLLS